jgi:hypothetical protein
MNQLYIANKYGLQLGDRLVREKGILSKHHGIYVGIHDGTPLVAENQNGIGVQYISLCNFLLGNSANLTRIEKFKGTEEARRSIIPRINKLLGTQYDLINFNCEHFVELIYTGRPTSKQVNTAFFGLGLLIFVGLLASAK